MPRLGIALLALAAVVGTGCVDRSLVIRSEPSGARLWVNGIERGTTPYVMRYVHPSRFDVRLEKEGYESVADEVVTPTHWDAVPGPDFFAENGPVRIRRQTTANFRLEPLKAASYTEDELRAILKEAEVFRAKADAAAKEPGTPGRTPQSPPRPAPAPRPGGR